MADQEQESINQVQAAQNAAAEAGVPSSALAGVGVDIVEIARIERILQRTPRFKERVYTQLERDYCERKPNPAVHYALFFAAKEAVLKALGTGFSGMGINDVQVDHDKRGKPLALLSGNAARLAEREGIREVFLSLSYTHTTAVASAVAARENDVPRKKAEDESEMARRLAAQFKDMKALLDQIDAKLTEIENSNSQGDDQQ